MRFGHDTTAWSLQEGGLRFTELQAVHVLERAILEHAPGSSRLRAKINRRLRQ